MKTIDRKLSRRAFLKTAGAAAVWANAAGTEASGSSASEVTSPRNIILIVTDDQRHDALGLRNAFFTTPHLDALARNGALFESAFVTTALCSPSRASILTGQYAHTHGVIDNNTPLPPHTPTFPQALQRSGYETAFVGKWHMGGAGDAPQPGFDRWVSFKGQGVYYNPVLNVDGERVEAQGYITDLLTDYAQAFLEKPRQRPFFLHLAHKAVHGDFSPAERHKGTYDGKTYPYPASMANTEENYRGKPAWVRAVRGSFHGVDGIYGKTTDMDTVTRKYAEAMCAVDDSVGRIMESLRKVGLLDSTLILFTSDNGFLWGEHGLIDKRAMYEPSIRVPLIAHCPGLVLEGHRPKGLVANIDLAPTILEAAGMTPAPWMQGRSFYPLLTPRETKWRDGFLYEYFWERSFPQTPTMFGVRTDRYSFAVYHGIWDRYELYDLENDPDQRNNLLSEFVQTHQGGELDNLIRRTASPEVKALFDEMRGRLNRLLEETGCASKPQWRFMG